MITLASRQRIAFVVGFLFLLNIGIALQTWRSTLIPTSRSRDAQYLLRSLREIEPRSFHELSPGVSLNEIAFVINVGGDESRWKHNCDVIYDVWAGEVQHAFWFANFQSGNSSMKRHANKLEATDIAERYLLMIGAVYDLLPVGIKWVVGLDEDSYVFTDNLVAALQEYDSSQPFVIGDISEDLQAVEWYSHMAFGGGGIAFSLPVVAALAHTPKYSVSACSEKYKHISTGDEKLSMCLADLGVPLTRHAGFHQMDMRGDIRPVLQYAFSQHPIITYHHVYAHDPLFMVSKTNIEGLQRLFESYKQHKALSSLFLALFYAHSSEKNVTIAYNVGYSIRLWNGELPQRFFAKHVPEYGYSPWQPRLSSGYATFETEPVSLDFYCNSATFEWQQTFINNDGFVTSVFIRVPSHALCPLDAMENVSLLDEIVVQHRPCASMHEQLRIVKDTQLQLELFVPDCRRKVIAAFGRR